MTPTDNLYYTTIFESVDWSGDMTAKKIDPTSGNVVDKEMWSVQDNLDPMVGLLTDTRTIYTFDTAVGGKLKLFKWDSMSATEQGWLNGVLHVSKDVVSVRSLSPLNLALHQQRRCRGVVHTRSEGDRKLVPHT